MCVPKIDRSLIISIFPQENQLINLENTKHPPVHLPLPHVLRETYLPRPLPHKPKQSSTISHLQLVQPTDSSQITTTR